MRSLLAPLFGLILLLPQVGGAPGISGPSFNGGVITNAMKVPQGCGTTPGYAFSTATNYGFCYDGSGPASDVNGTLSLQSIFLQNAAGNGAIAKSYAGTQNTPGYFTATAFGIKELKILTESSATAFVEEDWPAGTGSYQGGQINYCVIVILNNDYQVRCGSFKIATAVPGGGGTSFCVMNPAAPDQTNDGSAFASTNAGTLTYAFTATTGSNKCTFNVNAVSSFAQQAIAIIWGISGALDQSPTEWKPL